MAYLENQEKTDFGYIRDNLFRIREECAARADALGLPQPRLVAVTKSATNEEVIALVRDFGHREIAENRTSLFCERYGLFEDGERPQMHLIGSLQTNKVKYIAGKTDLIHSLDSERLAQEIEKQAAKRDVTIRVLMEINSAKEEAKGGILPEEAERFAESLAVYPHLVLSGVMTMGPVLSDSEGYRPYFRRTAAILRRLTDKGYIKEGDAVLSMGMSDSFGVAIEEGATIVRVGRALFRK